MISSLVLSSLVNMAEAGELRDEPYHVPSSEEAANICATATRSCDALEVRKQCDQERIAFRSRLTGASSPAGPWECSRSLLEESSCTLNLSAKLPADRDGDGRL